jgi:mannose-1-phosphate guanylyltransferase/mannose-6-phosphate isomerase
MDIPAKNQWPRPEPGQIAGLIGMKCGLRQFAVAPQHAIAYSAVMHSETRPWGAFHVLDEQPGFKVKRIVVVPGGRLSLQSHRHRAEHWTVVKGDATVTVDGKVDVLTRGAAIDIPLGAKHRLENLSQDSVEIIEVQFGDYLGEDDIIRYDDIYNRL